MIDGIDGPAAGLGLEGVVEGLELGVALQLRMQEPMVAARADDEPLRQVLAQTLDRRLANGEHECRLLQQAALA